MLQITDTLGIFKLCIQKNTCDSARKTDQLKSDRETKVNHQSASVLEIINVSHQRTEQL